MLHQRGRHEIASHGERPPGRHGVAAVRRWGFCAAGMLAVLLLSGCAGARYFQAGKKAADAENWDQAVVEYTRALKEEPENHIYRAQLAKALHEAAYIHIARGQELAKAGDYKSAMGEYQKAREYEPSNSFLAQLIALASAAMEVPDEPVAASAQEPVITPPILRQLPQTPVKLEFKSANPKDILRALGQYASINFVFDEQVPEKPVSITLDNVSFEQALTSIMIATRCFYRVIDPSTIMVAPDNPVKRRSIEQLQVRTFYISNADLTEMRNILQQAVGAQMVSVNTALGALTIKDTPEKLRVAEQVIRSNDKSRAEVLLELEIVEVNRQKVQQYGLDLGTNSGSQPTTFTAAFSPEGSTNGVIKGRDFLTANSLDYVFTIPTVSYKLLLSDSDSRIIANPKLRGVEGKPMSLKMGDRVPVPITTFTPIAGGGAAQQPITTFQYENIGINLDITPRVHRNNEVTLDVKLDISSISGTGFGGLPTFGNRQVSATMRLKEGESNLLGGLIREEERQFLSGLPGIKNIPYIGKIFSYNDTRKTQTDIVLSLTPHILRLPEITDTDRKPIWVGTMENPSPWGPLPQMRGPGERPVPPVMEGVEPGGTPERPPREPDYMTEEEPEEGEPVDEEPPSGRPGQASLSLNPSSSEVPSESEVTMSLDIAGVDNVGSVNLVLQYDPDLLAITDAGIQEGPFMRSEGGAATFFKHINAQAGTITIGITRSGTGAAKGASGAGTIATLVFTTTAEGDCSVEIQRATIMSAQFQPLTVDASAIADIQIYSEEGEEPPTEEEQ